MNQRSLPPKSVPDEQIDESLLDELSAVEFEALRWSVRVGDGLGAEARAEFQAWLDASPEHRAAYEDMADVMGAIDEIPPAGTARLRATVALDKAAESSAIDAPRTALPAHAQATVHAELSTEPDAAGKANGIRQQCENPIPARRQLLLHAALGALAVGLPAGWLGWDRLQGQVTFSRDYATQRGQNLDAELPDGSQLLLDTATQAQVTLYRNRREVRLPEGQVVFQVQADKSQPFDVLAGAARITVVGTRFSVRYTPSMGSKAVQVAVLEGKVRVTRARNEAGAAAVELVPGQTVSADEQGNLGPIGNIAPDAFAPWRHRRLNFDSTPLGAVLAELGRYGDVGLHVRDAAVARLPVTASVDFHQVDAFARSLPQVLPVRLERRGDVVEIVAR